VLDDGHTEEVNHLGQISESSEYVLRRPPTTEVCCWGIDIGDSESSRVEGNDVSGSRLWLDIGGTFKREIIWLPVSVKPK
jgi:hypothetical protein